MYRVLEIESQQEPPAKPITRTHHDACLMRMWYLRGGRVTVKESISCGYTGTRYGECGAGRERDVSQVHGGGVLARSSCARLARVLLTVSIDVSFRLFLLRCFVYETSQTRKKKKKHSYEYFFLDEFDGLNCVEAVQECFCVCDNYAVFCEIFDECF